MMTARRMGMGVFGAVALLGVGFAAGVRWPARPLQAGDTTDTRTVTPRGDLTEDELELIDLFDRAAPSVVYITSLTVRRDFLSRNVTEIPQGTGSGFLWDKRGHVVTNFHVINGADAAQVTLSDQSTWDAKLVGAAPEKDLAVLRIDASSDKLNPIPVGSSADLLVGQQVLAIGNPFGLDHTLTTGVISALGREIESVIRTPIRGVIQTDAAINPGNSGGPLIDTAGRLVGVNTAIFSPSGASAGIGFSIPVDDVRWVVPQLIENGRVIRPTLGVEVADARLTQRLGVHGVLVLNVVPGGGAEKAGIRPTSRDNRGRIQLGDIIVAIDGEPVESLGEILLLLERHTAGDRVTVTLQRRRRELQVEVLLQEGG